MSSETIKLLEADILKKEAIFASIAGGLMRGGAALGRFASQNKGFLANTARSVGNWATNQGIAGSKMIRNSPNIKAFDQGAKSLWGGVKRFGGAVNDFAGKPGVQAALQVAPIASTVLGSYDPDYKKGEDSCTTIEDILGKTKEQKTLERKAGTKIEPLKPAEDSPVKTSALKVPWKKEADYSPFERGLSTAAYGTFAAPYLFGGSDPDKFPHRDLTDTAALLTLAGLAGKHLYHDYHTEGKITPSSLLDLGGLGVMTAGTLLHHFGK